jgi:putative membrane protein
MVARSTSSRPSQPEETRREEEGRTPTMMLDMMMHGGWTAAWPWFALWVLAKVTVWVLVITALVFAVRHLRRGACAGRPSSPLDVVKMRYARGEVSRDEFEAMKHDLQAS